METKKRHNFIKELGAIATEYKTSLMGLGCLACIGLYWCNVITGEQFASGTALLTAAGLLRAKDG
jgi:hypothetical protein